MWMCEKSVVCVRVCEASSLFTSSLQQGRFQGMGKCLCEADLKLVVYPCQAALKRVVYLFEAALE